MDREVARFEEGEEGEENDQWGGDLMEDMTITIYRGKKGWIARYKGAGARHIWQLYGKNTVTLPYAYDEKESVVLDRVRELNPGTKVELA